MPIPLPWPQVAFRLISAIISGAAIGLNRSERGRAAGLRTSILVCLAACIAMVEVNLLLPMAGRAPDSFVMNDLMRLPLGILSGMGFIGGGAILHRGNFVTGVTTAATLWLLTVVGLCFGGGQLGLGYAGAGLALLVLAGLKQAEDRMAREHQGRLILLVSGSVSPGDEEIRAILREGGLRVSSSGLELLKAADQRQLTYDLRWKSNVDEITTPQPIQGLATLAGVTRVVWTPQAR